ncbi:MAG: hypothetical protein M1840_002385 [Geoglossum simile]|nr:MAG: hypothetical protein M1840_002385 [Geoglossum simile]
MVENLATQVGILEKQNKAQMALLNGRKTQQSGKRLAVKGHFVLSTKEVLEKVREVEEETACKKETAYKKATACKKATGTSQRGRKCKRSKTPSEDEEESSLLEEQLLDPILEAGTLRIVEPKILLECLIKTVEGECKEAEKAGQDVLLLVFGHGDSETYGVTIGSTFNTEFREMTAPQLQISRLRVAAGKKVKCTLLLTSCYSRGWVMNPDLNLTVIAAAGHEAKSQSWNASLAHGFSGSIVASVILNAILASKVEDEESLGKSGMTYQELQTTETYAEMSCLIHNHIKQNDRFHDHHEISFAAQNDKWTEAWRERTGIPMAFFKERWKELSVLPAQADGFSNRDPSSTFTGSFALGSLSETRFGSAMRLMPTKTMPQIYTMVRALAAGYAKSFPGMDNVSINTTLHTNVRLLLGGEGKYEDRMDGLLALGYTLSYRLEGMTMATNYKDFLGLDYPDCASCCIEAWTFPLYESKEKEAKEKLAKYAEVKLMIKAAKIFSTAADGQGYDYDKPEEYLAIAFVESGKSKNEVEQAIAVLKGLHTTLITPKVQEVRRGRWFVDKANQILKPVKKTLRSISPRKRRSLLF